MLLKERHSGQMLAVEHVTDLFKLNHDCITGRFQYGEEEQDPETFRKLDLVFLSDRNQRVAVISVASFFLIGLLLLQRVREPQRGEIRKE